MGWGGFLLDLIIKLDLYVGDGLNNYVKWYNKEFDVLVKKVEVE